MSENATVDAVKADEAAAVMKEIIDTASSENRDLTADEAARFDNAEQAHRSHVAQMELRSRAAAVAAEAENLRENAAFRSLASAGVLGGTADAAPQMQQRSMRDVIRSAALEDRGFSADIDLRSASLKRGVETRAMHVTTTPDLGGLLVKETWADSIANQVLGISSILSSGIEIKTTGNGEQINLPTRKTLPSLTWNIGQGQDLTESNGTFGSQTLLAYKGSYYSYVSTEMLEDSAYPVEDELAAQAAEAVQNGLGAAVCAGSGTGEPTGLLTSAEGIVSGNLAAGPTYDQLMNLEASVASAAMRSGARAAYVMAPATMYKLRKLKDSNGRPLWNPLSMVDGTPNMLNGRPIYLDDALAGGEILFGDLSAYTLRLVRDWRFEKSTDHKFTEDVVTYRTVIRADGKLLVPAAMAKFIGA